MTEEPKEQRSWPFPYQTKHKVWKWFEHTRLWFSSKQPITPKEVSIPELPDVLAKLYAMKPGFKYVLWFEPLINPQHLDMIRRHLRDELGIKVVVIAGIKVPQIYEFEDTTDGSTKFTGTPLIDPSKTGTEGK